MKDIKDLHEKLKLLFPCENPTEEIYDKALKLLDDFGDENLSPYYLIKKYIYIQLSSESNKYSLADSVKCLERALDIHPNYWEALLELAHYHDLEGSGKVASDYYKKAIDQVVKIAIEVICDYGEYVQECNGVESARDVVAEIQQRIFANPKIEIISKGKEG